MARSLIYAVNIGSQTVSANGVVSLGTVIRRYGCNFGLAGNGIEMRGAGYYDLACNITAEPTAIGPITATLLRDGVAIPGATATVNATAAGDPVTIPLIGVVRETCCDSASTITCTLSAEATVTSVAFKGERE